MTLVNFTFPQLGGNNGKISAYPEQSFSAGGKTFIKGVLIDTKLVTATAGTVQLDLPATKDLGVRIRLDIEQSNEVIDTIYIVVPESGIAVAGGELLNSFYSPDTIASSHAAVAEILSKDTNFVSRLSGFEEVPYDADYTYRLGQYSFLGDTLYKWVSATQSKGKSPAIAANIGPFWAVAAKLSAVPSGTVSEKAYNKTTFASLTTEPASRSNLVELENKLIAAIPSLDGYAREDDIDTFFYNRTQVDALLNALPAGGGGTAGLTLYVWASKGYMTGDVTQSDAKKDILWETAPANSSRLLSNGKLKIENAGTYLLVSTLELRMRAEYAQAYGTLAINVDLAQYSASLGRTVAIGSLLATSFNEEVNAQIQATTGARLFTAGVGDLINMRLENTSPRARGNSFADVVSKSTVNTFSLFKVA